MVTSIFSGSKYIMKLLCYIRLCILYVQVIINDKYITTSAKVEPAANPS